MKILKEDLIIFLNQYNNFELLLDDTLKIHLFKNNNLIECELKQKNKNGRYNIIYCFKPNKNINKILQAINILFDIELI